MELDRRSMRLAQHFRSHGIHRGDHIAILMENSPDYLVACCAAQRSGLHYTPVNWHLSPDEISYVVQDCDAKALVVSPAQLKVVQAVSKAIPDISVRVVTGPAFDDYEGLQVICQRDYAIPLDQSEGSAMFYSSGTTGRPKGIKRALPEGVWGAVNPGGTFFNAFWGVDTSTIYLCPAPLYHAAPLGWITNILRVGGTIVLMEKFDPLNVLQLIERYKITHVQFVPTMFIRMLNLPQEQRLAYDLSSLKRVVHAGAPCPLEVKRKMIEWLGPVISEYYSGSEGNGFCAVNSQEWLARPGTVGRSLFGPVHIVGEDGKELPPGEIGTIYFSGLPTFEYHNDPDKTKSAYVREGWSTLGDIGHVDADGYVFLSDRRTDLIISGGVNIYPRETEEALLPHPAVLDVAVVGVPSPDFGEDVLAVVELKEGFNAGAALGQELIDFCRSRIARYKCPKRVEFAVLPRTPTGKMLRRKVKEQYRESGG